ncbi:MFS general substrate transporter [Xylariomycetidae sp. FL0641]|nr:MFS general substrate transporter [Xylariomycetidae sp. FL0641]
MSAVPRPLAWFAREFGLASIHRTGRNAYLIILARTCRMFAYGTNALILAIFFSALGVSDHQIGIFMTLTLVGDVVLGTFLSLVADRVGRRRVLLGGSLLMVLSGTIFALFENFWILLLGAVVGVISITGGDFGPFRSIEESVLSQLTTPETRPDVLAWHVSTPLLGSAVGSEVSGRVIHYLRGERGWSEVDAYHALFWIYAAMGLVNLALVLPLTGECELPPPASSSYARLAQDENPSSAPEPRTRLPRDGPAAASWLPTRLPARISPPTRAVTARLWALLALDSLADGMVPYSLTNYFLAVRFAPGAATLGDVTAAAYALGALAAVFAGPLARRVGLVRTMVFTHAPSSAAVLLFPSAPVFGAAAALLLVRAGLNNMDQAPRAAFIAAVVRPAERTAVMGITSTVRTLAAMAGPTLTGVLAAGGKFWIAFVAAGLFRLAYDFGLYAMFVNMKLYQHEEAPENSGGRRARDEEMELESLAESDSVGRPSVEDDASDVGVVPKAALKVPADGQRVRSRSPHRLEGS